jgi:hypothetical protein
MHVINQPLLMATSDSTYSNYKQLLDQMQHLYMYYACTVAIAPLPWTAARPDRGPNPESGGQTSRMHAVINHAARHINPYRYNYI